MILLENIPKEINKAQYSDNRLPTPQNYISLKDACKMYVTHRESIGKKEMIKMMTNVPLGGYSKTFIDTLRKI